MRQLFGKSSLTVFQAMEEIFTACNQKNGMVVLQNYERSFRSEKLPSVVQAKFGYWHLWLDTWRHFTRLGQGCPKHKDGVTTVRLEYGENGPKRVKIPLSEAV